MSKITDDTYVRALGRRAAVRPVSGASFAGTSISPNSIAPIFAAALAPVLEIALNGPIGPASNGVSTPLIARAVVWRNHCTFVRWITAEIYWARSGDD